LGLMMTIEEWNNKQSNSMENTTHCAQSEIAQIRSDYARFGPSVKTCVFGNEWSESPWRFAPFVPFVPFVWERLFKRL
jgi:hypothetical protein